MSISKAAEGAPLNAGRYAVGQVVGAASAGYGTSRTTPPDYFDLATLLDAMLSADRFATTEADRQVLRQVEGLGTSRTRQAIVDEMVRKGQLVVERKGKRHIVRPTPFGMKLRDLLPGILSDVALTARWEVAFGMVERGEVDRERVVDRTYGLIDEVIKIAKSQAPAAGGGPRRMQ